MITDIIISAFVAGIGALLDLLPTWTIPTIPVTSAPITAAEQLSRVFPVMSVVVVLLLILGLKVLLGAFDVAVWVYHQFWGSS